jgi:hypothetical protein
VIFEKLESNEEKSQRKQAEYEFKASNTKGKIIKKEKN